MGAIRFLKQQHQEVKDLFKKCLQEDDARERGRIVQEIVKNLIVHSEIEEKLVYPRLAAASDELKEHMGESQQEHHMVRLAIDEIENTRAEDESCPARIKVLKDMVEHHIEEEEEIVFPLAEKACGLDALRQLGDELQRKSDELKGKGTRLLVTMMREQAREEAKR